MIDENWTELKIEVPQEMADAAVDIANMVVPYGIYIEDYSDLESAAKEIAHIDLIDEELLQKDRTKAIIHVYISPEESPSEAAAFLTERYNSEKIPFMIDESSCKTEDWINNWKKYFKPIEVGKKLLICPIWEEEADAGDRQVLKLEPGLAFGTGTHETTRLCMELIEKYLKPGQRFLDIGCGSGILSVAALLLGAESAVGVDIDPLAVKTAKENAVKNGVSEKFIGLCGNLTEKVSGQYGMAVANIVADAVIELSRDIGGFISEDSVYIISGIIDSREEDVKAAVRTHYDIIERWEENGWIAMALRKHA